MRRNITVEAVVQVHVGFVMIKLALGPGFTCCLGLVN